MHFCRGLKRSQHYGPRVSAQASQSGDPGTHGTPVGLIGPLDIIMEVRATWEGATSGISPWLPSDRIPAWSRSKVIYWRCSQSGYTQSTGFVVDPQLPSLGECAAARTLRTTTEELLLHHVAGAPLQQGRVYVIYGSLVPVWHADFSRWEIELPKISPTSGCVRILNHDLPHERFNVAEVFCGYMGGWSSAADVLPKWKPQLAIDINPKAVAAFVRNHGGRVISRPERLSESTSNELLALNHDVCDLTWLNAFNYTEVDVMTWSAPCQSWSSMGSQTGTASPNGQVLVGAVQIARLLQVPMILMEQVAGFRRHEEFDDFIRTMSEAGYRLVSSGVLDLAHYSYTSRRRWLAVFMNTLNVSRWDTLGCFLNSGVREMDHVFNPREHCLAFLSEKHLDEVSLNPEEIMKMDDPQLLPPWKRGDPEYKHGAMPARLHSGSSVLPTIQAAYRKAIQFSNELLKSRGLMSWAIRDPHGQVRWLQKFEAARAMGFGTHVTLPATETEAYEAVGNAISPMHAARVMVSAEVAAKVQYGLAPDANFAQTLQALRDRQLSLQEAVVQDNEAGYQLLAFRLLHPGFRITCPLCGQDSSLPLVQACQVCQIIACKECASVECNATHARLRDEEVSDTSIDVGEQAQQVGAQFMITEIGTLDKLFAGTRNISSMAQFLQEHDIPVTSWIFKNGEQMDLEYRPCHADEIYLTSAFAYGCDCPNCHKADQEGRRRLCLHCCFVGCRHCVAESCLRCCPGMTICKRCHSQLAAKHLRSINESYAQKEDEDVQTLTYDWEQVLQCGIEAQWQHVTVLNFPYGRTTIHRGMFADKGHILRRLSVAGYEPQGESVLFWGTSKRPNLDHAVCSYIMVVPRDELVEGVVPIVCKSIEEEVVLCLPNNRSADQWCEMILTPTEWRNGYMLVQGDEELAGSTVVSMFPGMVVQKVAPWRRNVGDSLRVVVGNHAAEEATIPVQARLPRTRSHYVTTLSGYVNLAGKFRAIPRPRAGQTWPEWLTSAGEMISPEVWATCDGKHLPHDCALSGEPMILRLHYRVRGGAKESQRHDAMQKKLSSHLVEKGVPEDLALERAGKVIATIGLPAVESAYASIDPWRVLKEATKDRMRLVLQDEFKSGKVEDNKA